MVKQLIRVDNFLTAANVAGQKADETDFDRGFRMALHVSRLASLRETEHNAQLLGAVVTLKRDAVLAVSASSSKTGMKKALARRSAQRLFPVHPRIPRESGRTGEQGGLAVGALRQITSSA